MKWRKPLAIVGLVGAVAALSIVGTAFAQTPTPNQQGKAGNNELFLDRLASALGTTRDKLNSAFTQARNETVDQRVKDGRLTQEQADKIKAQEGTAIFGFGARGFDRGPRDGRAPMMAGGQTNEAVAKALGMTTNELANQIKSGKSLAELAKGKEQAVKDAIAGVMKAQLDQAVKDGKMTQEQANQRLEQIKNSDLNRLLGPWGKGGMRGEGNHMRSPAGKPSATPGAAGKTQS